MGQFRVVDEQKGQELYLYHSIYAGSMLIASFPSPKTEYVGKGQLINKANPKYGKELPYIHPALVGVHIGHLWTFIKENKTVMHFDVYDKI
jgi:hypothetical protein